MQLFWKQNRYTFNNSQYGPKRPELGDRSRDHIVLTRASSGAATSTASVTNLRSPETRPKTQIPLWIITYEPGPTRTLWVDGKCLGTSLSTFISGISQVTQRSDAEGIKLILSTPSWNTRIIVPKDAENVWELAKKTIIAALKEARAELEGEMGNCKILIEPVY